MSTTAEFFGLCTAQREVTQSKQSWNLTAVYTNENVKLQVKICRDAYDFQCYARIKYWDGKWVYVAHIPSEAMTPGSCKASREDAEDFLYTDESKLLHLANKILSK